MEINKSISLLLSIFLFTGIQAQNEKISFQSTIKVGEKDTEEVIIKKAAHVIPNKNQLAALENEFIAFIHFGPNTFTRMEWGNGMEDPKVFALKELDTDQWCEAMKAAGMKMVVLTVKHHDGFVLWQSRYTTHGIMSTNFRNGQGDIVKDLSASCRKYGLKLGVYLSPADLYQIESPEGLYGNLSIKIKRTIPREVPGRPFQNETKFQFIVDDYNEYFLNQLFELLTEYGPIHEVWFDGAHPKRKGGQTYNYGAWRELIRKLAPEAVVFGKEDIRWCGNEGGGTRNTEWNVIVYEEDPNQMNDFRDLMDNDLGSREVLFAKKKPYYLHYQPAETNTSIREGWFYRDDTYQKVRSADDVFDIYERAVGGNSIFLLNIPPNREGRFPDTDVTVLNEVGKRIKETYSINLLVGADGPKEVLDDNKDTYLFLDNQPQEIIISTPTPVKINRISIQEAISTHGERVEKHAVDAFIDGNWKEIIRATDIGYKRILRFQEVTTDKIRIRVLESRLSPAIVSISAYYYRTRPPMLGARRNVEGFVTIIPGNQDFHWNITDHNSGENLSSGYKIYYTTDGSEPSVSTMMYKEPLLIQNEELKTVAVLNGEQGPVYWERFGIIKKDWKLQAVSSEKEGRPARAVFDEDSNSYWMSEEGVGPHFISMDLGKSYQLTGFAYTPQRRDSRGMMEEGVFQVSEDGINWKEVESFKFGNLINDPEKRYHYFEKPVTTRYIRVEATTIAADGKELAIAELDLF